MTNWRARISWGAAAVGAFAVGWASHFAPSLYANVQAGFQNEVTARAWTLASAVVQTIILAASVLYAASLYYVTQRTAAQKNTLERIFEEHGDKDIVNQRLKYREIRDDEGDRLARYAGDVKEFRRKMWEAFLPAHLATKYANEDERRKAEAEQHAKMRREERKWLEAQVAIQAVLNRYETFAIGIRAKAIDETMYRLWWKTQLIKDWHASRDLILAIQKTSPNAYIEFSALAQKWEQEDIDRRRDAQH